MTVWLRLAMLMCGVEFKNTYFKSVNKTQMDTHMHTKDLNYHPEICIVYIILESHADVFFMLAGSWDNE